jgi:hypothetical protein
MPQGLLPQIPPLLLTPCQRREYVSCKVPHDQPILTIYPLRKWR